KLGIPSTTFYRWYDRYRSFGEAGLEDRTSGHGRASFPSGQRAGFVPFSPRSTPQGWTRSIRSQETDRA
ncbi:MAG: helix-turn-helix domain-containing protein, partial [Alphaproteobacteria bacterium]|nr:helix-turn-helix domain-containing protein [Alphaproteobacteria bacterium]